VIEDARASGQAPGRLVVATAVAAFRSRRLRLTGLDDTARLVARAALVALALIGVLIVAQGLGLDGGHILPDYGPVPAVVVVAWLVGLALTAVTWSFATVDRGGWAWAAGRLVLALTGASLGAFLVKVRDDLEEAAVPGQTLDLSAIIAVGWIVVGLSALPLVLPRRWLAERKRIASLLAASPFVAALVAYAIAGSGSITISDDFISRPGNTGWPSTLTHRGAVGTAVLDAGLVVLFALQVILLVQILEATRLARDASAGAARRLQSHPRVTVALVLVKVGFLVLVVADIVPGSAPGLLDTALKEGVVSWLIAAAIAVAVLALVARPLAAASDRDIIAEDRSVQLASVAVVGALAAPLVVGSLAYALEHVLFLLPGTFGDTLAEALVDGAVRASPWLLVAAMLAMAFAGGLLVWRVDRHRWTTGVVLLAVGLWCAPRALTIAHDLLVYPSPIYAIGDPGDFVERGVQEPGWVNIATVDAFVTIGIAALVLRRRSALDPDVGSRILFVLLTMTIITYAGTFLPRELEGGALFHLGLVLPVLYVFGFDSTALNRAASPNWAVLLAIGGALLALTTASLLLATDSLSADSRSYGEFGSAVAKFPLVVPLVVISLRGRLRTPDLAPPAVAQDGDGHHSARGVA
jgi:hypothetical protein